MNVLNAQKNFATKGNYHPYLESNNYNEFLEYKEIEVNLNL